MASQHLKYTRGILTIQMLYLKRPISKPLTLKALALEGSIYFSDLN